MSSNLASEAERELARRELERRKAKKDPLYLVSQMVGVDQRTGEKFDFSHIGEPLPEGYVTYEDSTLRSNHRDWRWQRWYAEKCLSERRKITLKGRQIGATWVELAVDCAEAITMPDTASLLYRQKEDEAIDNVRRWFRLYQSIPKHFTSHIKVLKPDLNKTAQPGRDGVALLFPDGSISEIIPMTSAGSSGHGRSVRRILGDEAAYVELLEQIMAAVEPAAGPAYISLVSTANGRHNEETGEGNEFSRRWTDAEMGTKAYTPIFLPYDIHPDRDQEWWDTAPEVQSLKPHQRHAQFPRTKHEAFSLSSRTFFDPEDLMHYRELVQSPLRRIEFRRSLADRAKVEELPSSGLIKIFAEPDPEKKYAIACDVSTGRGMDYSAGYVIDLAEMSIAAELHGKPDADQLGFQLHYLGRFYNTALIAPEIGGGYGEPVIIALRDGREGRPPYPKLYRHAQHSRPDRPVQKPYGFPTNSKTRPLILNQLEKAVRERTLPFVTSSLLYEMESFVYHDSGTSPRALEGSRDDCVMAAAIGLELYRLHGEHPDKRRRKKPNPYKSPYPWEQKSYASK